MFNLIDRYCNVLPPNELHSGLKYRKVQIHTKKHTPRGYEGMVQKIHACYKGMVQKIHACGWPSCQHM